MMSRGKGSVDGIVHNHQDHFGFNWSSPSKTSPSKDSRASPSLASTESGYSSSRYSDEVDILLPRPVELSAQDVEVKLEKSKNCPFWLPVVGSKICNSSPSSSR
jgi:hypothetical protein